MNSTVTELLRQVLVRNYEVWFQPGLDGMVIINYRYGPNGSDHNQAYVGYPGSDPETLDLEIRQNLAWFISRIDYGNP